MESLGACFHKDVLPNTLTMKPLVATMESDIGILWRSFAATAFKATHKIQRDHPTNGPTLSKHRGKVMPDFRWRKKFPVFVRKREEDGCSSSESVRPSRAFVSVNTFARDKQCRLNGLSSGICLLIVHSLPHAVAITNFDTSILSH